MSAASTPAPRSKSPSEARPFGSRHTLFLPMLILLFGSGTLALYQVMTMEDRLDQLTQTVDKLDANVKRAQHDKTIFLELARDVLHLAPNDPNAEKIAVYFKLRELQTTRPELFSLNMSSAPSATNAASAQPSGSTAK